MFTGLIADVGELAAVEAGGDGARLRVTTGLAGQIEPGGSVAVNGVCLTAAEVAEDGFSAEAMNQTLSLTALGALGAGDRVNLELALRASDRLGGHVVQGHVDGTGEVLALSGDGFARRLSIAAPAELLELVVERGSIAVDGVSLTVSALAADSVEVSLIPETLERTTLGGLKPGQQVNIECDVLAKYVRRLISQNQGDGEDV
ncbi:MAG: riboflavin synthase [Solirubrobacterales bacterium]|jgi:riboflavin synthase|nr:riboflavin synthase [Solirubrobacterales bacterium]